jgi:hypothetical protein
MFADYNKKGSLYIVLFKKENTRYQFHYKTNMFMNENDAEINPNELAEKYPILWKIFTPIAIENNSSILNSKPSEAVQMTAVTQNGRAINYIKNPSEAVQMTAVTQNGRAINYIKNPSEAVQMTAVTQHGGAIYYIKNPSEAVQMTAVTQDGRAIEYIKNPSEKVKVLSKKNRK